MNAASPLLGLGRTIAARHLVEEAKVAEVDIELQVVIQMIAAERVSLLSND